jgi:enoyl-CoA hydratase/carnithine racemase
VSEQELLIEPANGILRLTINRPGAANAINDVVAACLAQALSMADSDDSIRAVLLTGSGNRNFCAGRDMKNPHNLSPMQLADQRRSESKAYIDALLTCRKPVVAAINGAAVGAGWMIALLADQIIAADHAVMSLPEIDVKIPTFIGHALISLRAGEALATDLVLTGRRMSAQEALQRGLVSAVVSSDRFSKEAEAAAALLAAKHSETMRDMKEWILARRRELIDLAGGAFDAVQSRLNQAKPDVS